MYHLRHVFVTFLEADRFYQICLHNMCVMLVSPTSELYDILAMFLACSYGPWFYIKFKLYTYMIPGSTGFLDREVGTHIYTTYSFFYQPYNYFISNQFSRWNKISIDSSRPTLEVIVSNGVWFLDVNQYINLVLQLADTIRMSFNVLVSERRAERNNYSTSSCPGQ